MDDGCFVPSAILRTACMQGPELQMQARHFEEAARDLQYTLLEQEAAAMIAKQQQKQQASGCVGELTGTQVLGVSCRHIRHSKSPASI